MFAEVDFRNLRVAETEKYAHVTYFFNGGVEKPFPGEERILVPSPKVATYDLKPEMSAAGIADSVIQAIEKGEFDAMIMNFANADMVGHSGKLEATISAVETVDACLGRIFQSLRPRGGAWIITADHGNAETMIDPVTGGPHTYHTTNPVPFILLDEDGPAKLQPGGALRDIAPTMLGVLGIPQPEEMTGSDLRIRKRTNNEMSPPTARRHQAGHLRPTIASRYGVRRRRWPSACEKRGPRCACWTCRITTESRRSCPIPIFSWACCCGPSSCGIATRLKWVHTTSAGVAPADVSRIARLWDHS